MTLRSIFNSISSSLPQAAGVLAALGIMLMAACERRPLEDPEDFANVRIKINTNAIFNVTTGIYNENIPVPDVTPEVMHVLFFEGNGDDLVTETYISNRETDEEGNTFISGTIQIDPGKYRMMIYNFDTKTTNIRSYNKWPLAEAYTNPVAEHIASRYYASKAEEAASSKAGESALADMEIVAYEPDHLLVATKPELLIPYHEGTFTIHADAHTIIDTYYLQIYVEGVEWVSSASAYLTGMSSGNVLSENRRITDPSHTVYFTLNPSMDGDRSVIANVFNTFGHIPGNTNSLDITFSLKTRDGRSLQHTFDITDLFDTPEAKEKHWLIINETITVEPPSDYNPDAGGGMDPSVDDWVNENHNIEL